RYSTRSSDSALNGKSGEFDVSKAGGRSPLMKDGALRVSRDGFYLTHADQKPFFWLGDTCWNGALLASKADWEAYLKDRADKRFSVIQLVLTAPWRTAPADELSEVAFTGKEKVEINPKFFQRMDERINAVNDHGM